MAVYMSLANKVYITWSNAVITNQIKIKINQGAIQYVLKP